MDILSGSTTSTFWSLFTIALKLVVIKLPYSLLETKFVSIQMTNAANEARQPSYRDIAKVEVRSFHLLKDLKLEYVKNLSSNLPANQIEASL